VVSQSSNDRQRAAREKRNFRFKFKRVAFHLTTSQISGLKQKSKADGQPFAEHLRLAIDAYLGVETEHIDSDNSSESGEQ